MSVSQPPRRPYDPLKGLRAFLCSPANARFFNRAKPTALDLVLWLIGQGGVSDRSEIALAQALGCSDRAVHSSLAWLESEGALIVDRRCVGGLRLAYVRKLSVPGCFALFGRVLGKVAASVALVARRLRSRAIMRSFRARPSERVHTERAAAESLGNIISSSVGPAPDASQLLLRSQQGEISLDAATVAALVVQVAGEMGLGLEETARDFGVRW